MIKHHHLPSLSPSQKCRGKPHFAIGRRSARFFGMLPKHENGFLLGKALLWNRSPEAETAKQESPEFPSFRFAVGFPAFFSIAKNCEESFYRPV